MSKLVGLHRRVRDADIDRRIPNAIGFGVVLASAVGYAVDPDGVGGLVYLSTSVLLILAITIGPLLRGVQPRRIWFIETAAGVTLWLSLFGQLVDLNLGPVKYVDITYFSGYVLLLLWLTLLSRHVVGEGDRTSILDSASAGVGVGLALWATVLAPLIGGGQLPFGLLYAVYPTVDVVLLALAVHLAVRLEVRVAAVWWLIGAVCVQLVVDTLHSLVRLVAPGSNTAPIVACFIFWLFGLAVAATHPSVVDLSRQPKTPRRRFRAENGGFLMVLAVSPAVLSTAIPVTGLIDTVVRTVLVALLLALLIVRLRRTMAALSHAEVASHHRATHDELTGLLNRAALLETLERLLARNAILGRPTAVLFFDCDDFKHVNDTWGHHAGDALLHDIAERLPRLLRPRTSSPVTAATSSSSSRRSTTKTARWRSPSASWTSSPHPCASSRVGPTR